MICVDGDQYCACGNVSDLATEVTSVDVDQYCACSNASDLGLQK